MKLITRDTDYALRAICVIAKRRGKIVPVKQLAADSSVPRPYLRKILQVLNKQGVLKSYKGKDGGFLLALPVDKIYLLSLMRIFQGDPKLNDCLLKKKACPRISSCRLRKKLRRIEEHVFRELKPVSIASLLKKG